MLTLLLLVGMYRPLTMTQVCQTKWGLDHRHVKVEMKRQVAAVANIPWSETKNYIFDHIVPRELGGADDVRNLQIQCCYKNGHITGPAHEKDLLENRLHRAVCNGTISLEAAQKVFTNGW